MKYYNRTIFTSMEDAKFLYLYFISAKFSCCIARVCFAAVGVEYQNHAIHIRGALTSYDFSTLSQGEIFYSDFISALFSYSNKTVNFAIVGVKH